MRGMIEMPVRSKFLTVGQMAIGGIAVLAALVLVAGPSGAARLPGIVAAIVVMVGAVWLIRGVRRQAIIVDGTRFGWRGGLTGKVVGWTDLDDVELASTARVSSSITRKHPGRDPVDEIGWPHRAAGACCWTSSSPRRCGPGRGRPVPAAWNCNPFIVPFSAFSDDHRDTVRAMLGQRGLLPA